MKKGKLIVFEGTDCSGKETQSNILLEELNKMGCETKKYCFPNYDSPTGKIIAGAYLGKQGYMEPVFNEGASKVDAKVASLYFAADRKYNINQILQTLNSGVNVILDRYIDSNLAHQSSKINDKKEQKEMFRFLEKLEYGLLKLPKADVTVFLYLPVWATCELKKDRKEIPDQHEQDLNYLNNSEKVYLQLAKKNKYLKIDCVKDKRIKNKNEIAEEILQNLSKKLNIFKKNTKN